MSTLTADAAAQHGHEFSPPRASSPSDISFLRSPLSILTYATRRPSPPTTPNAISPSTLKPGAPTPETTSKVHKTLMFAEIDPRPSFSPEHSRPVSSSSVCSSEDKPKRRPPRSKTTYNLAHPPPPTAPRQKLHLRPKVLLQLQQVVPSRRPKPVYEVIPSSIFVPRIAWKFARVFKSKDKLGPADILVVKAEEYGPPDDEESSDDERWGSRDVIGVVCCGKKDENRECVKTEILMDDGLNWEASTLPNGSYEFVYTDCHGLQLKCRWIARTTPARRTSGTSATPQGWPSSAPAGEDKKFNFSTISPDSRRHPIIATMTRASIDVLDYYTMPTSSSLTQSSASPVHTPSNMSDAGSFMDAAEVISERSPIKTDEALRKLIIVSGIYVAFRENWSAVFNYSKTTCGCTNQHSSTATSKSRPSPLARAVSVPVVDTPPIPRSLTPDETRRTLPALLRNSTQILHRNSSVSSPSPSASTSTATSPTHVSEPKVRARRSNSTGTEFTGRNRNSLRKRYGLKLEDQSLPEIDNELERERSAEMARMKLIRSPSAQMIPAASLPTPPIRIAEATPETTPTPSSLRRNTRRDNSQSAYYPVEPTAGLWGSGDPGPAGARKRPTSMFVDEEGAGEKGKGGKRRSSGRFRRILGIFRRNGD